MTTHVFTSAAMNYFPKVRVLCESIREYHPELVVHLALADEATDAEERLGSLVDDVIRIKDLRIPNERSWVFGHSVVELSTALKPFVVRHLLGKERSGNILYFDPDIVLFSRLDDLLNEFQSASILLTPHLTVPEGTVEGIRDLEVNSLRYGMFNLGFIGIRNDAHGQAFANWWAHRSYHFCTDDLDAGLWQDQKWIDFAPIFFEKVRILKDVRHNVAPWNLSARKVEGSLADGFTVDGRPMGFYHFTGIDSGAHGVMARKYAGRNAAITELIDWYERSIIGGGATHAIRWAYEAFDNGMPITRAHRVVYRRRVDLQTRYPDPFESETRSSYYKWFKRHGALEYPELLGPTPPSWRTIASLCRLAWSYGLLLVTAPRHAGVVCQVVFRKAWRVLRAEGCNGLRRRLVSKMPR